MSPITDLDIEKLIKTTQDAMEAQENLSPALKICIDTLLVVVREIIPLREEVIRLRKRVAELERKLALNSTNSSLPPSSDPPGKKDKKEGNSKKNSGAQKGHTGHSLKFEENPQETVRCYYTENCKKCGSSPDSFKSSFHSKRQLFHVKEKKHVIEYRQMKSVCQCSRIYYGKYPENIRYRVQYSKHVQALAVYFSQVQLIVPQRVTHTFWDCFELKVSEGTIHNFISRLSVKLSDFEKFLIQSLLAQEVLHVDETPLKVDGGLSYIHVASSVYLTYLFGHKHRSKEAIKEMGVLEQYKGALIHDCYSMYFGYSDMKHGTCGAHLIRELSFCEENEKQYWAHMMRRFLSDLNVYMKDYDLKKDDLIRLDYAYDNIVKAALEETKDLEKGFKSIPLAKRFRDKKENVLLFMKNPKVPFTNNLAERDLRMSKVKQKISCQFKSLGGLKNFCRIRSFTGTLRKLKLNIMDAIQSYYDDSQSVIDQIAIRLKELY